MEDHLGILDPAGRIFDAHVSFIRDAPHKVVPISNECRFCYFVCFLIEWNGYQVTELASERSAREFTHFSLMNPRTDSENHHVDY
jgi:hypothetical protein